jgi:hypothetical protein
MAAVKSCSSTACALRRVAANAQEAAHALFLSEASEQEEPDPKEGYGRQNPRQDVAQPGAFHHTGIGHVIFRQAIGEVGFDPGGHDRRLATAIRRFQAPGDPAVRHQYFGNAPLRQRLLEFTVWHGLDRLSRLPVVLQHEQQEDRDDPVADIPLIFLLHNRHPSRIESLRIGCEQTRQSVAQPDRKRAYAALPGTYIG